MKNISFTPLGDGAIVIDFGEGIGLEKNELILEWQYAIEANPFPGFIEAVPAYTTLTIFYDPVSVGTDFPYETVKNALQNLPIKNQQTARKAKIVEIPVCYEEPFALDLAFVAEQNGLTKHEVIQLHSDNVYHVYFLGFAPGFPFLGGMNEKLSTPRRSSPRLKIPGGAVGIAGGQTGIYPLTSPGGWQIIGRTPLQLFDVNANPPTLILPGDQIRFVPISKEDYAAWEEKS
ncbi:5-oxoprolinase subunit PxpB [Lederbergia citrea]|uniref:5-oxoprolinase subunit PxpB n=1 Tax=Lederbergia citrea TaxID=2833581 RepID=UPI001BCA6679|nr:5-oxoprolinase subunit PxpB [Lederbergia citrea]MBS4178956.1 5-oxoprolinase subunit PxpB [Lederbergia citrea]MBS4205637.1 5-oxoprolinase subunit PxpB [Lederbergia citrea]